MKLANILTLAVVLSGIIAQAGETPKQVPYELKARSSFSLATETRSPFWPVGWRPAGAAEPSGTDTTPVVDTAPKFQLSSESFIVSSVLLANPALATINGRSFGEGEYLPVVSNEQRLKVQDYAIREQGVWLRLDNQKPILVPMRRGEIRPKTTPQFNQEWAIKLTNK